MSSIDPDAELAATMARTPGLRAALGRLVTAGLVLLSTRAELLGVEVAEERGRLAQRLVFVAAGGLIIAFGVMFAGGFAIVLFWDTHRLWAIAVVALAHFAVGAFLLTRARAIGRHAPPPFAASIEQLKKDRTFVESSLGGRDDE